MSFNLGAKGQLNVGIVDDSPLIRQMIASIIEEAPDMGISGMAADPYEARQMIKDTNPDVITLDIEMPKMNGIEFLDKIMTLRPMPVIMVSTMTQKGAEITLQALEMGAIDVVAKPSKVSHSDDLMDVFRKELLPKLYAAKHSNLTHAKSLNVKPQRLHKAQNDSRYSLVGIASSTGGVERLRYLISNLSLNMPPILITQHINYTYVPGMIERLQQIAPRGSVVKVAEHNEILQRNTVYFANNQKHLSFIQRGDLLKAQLIDAPPRNGFIASADYLFSAMAELNDPNQLGVILSGMGNDGAEGLYTLKQSGARTIAENEQSCLVYGMPRAAAEKGALSEELSIENILKDLNRPA